MSRRLPNTLPKEVADALPALPGAIPLPTTRTPAPPKGFRAPSAKSMLGSHARSVEVALASGVIEELRAFSDYEALLGALVPPADTIAGLLELATQWRAERMAAEAWNRYVRARDGVAWKVALDLMDRLKPAFLLNATDGSELAGLYPLLTQFFNAHKKIAARAVETKRSRKKKKQQAEMEATSDLEVTQK